jgi:hypothetical protein
VAAPHPTASPAPRPTVGISSHSMATRPTSWGWCTRRLLPNQSIRTDIQRHVLLSRVLTMDKTPQNRPTKSGQNQKSRSPSFVSTRDDYKSMK